MHGYKVSWTSLVAQTVKRLSTSTLATSCEELTHMKRLWCWEELGAGGEGVDRGWDGWMASLTRWTWIWVNSGSWWWTGRPGMLWFMGSQRVRDDWATELNWYFKSFHWQTDLIFHLLIKLRQDLSKTFQDFYLYQFFWNFNIFLQKYFVIIKHNGIALQLHHNK